MCMCVYGVDRGQNQRERKKLDSGCGGKIAPIKLCFAIWEKGLKRNLKASDILLSFILFNEV